MRLLSRKYLILLCICFVANDTAGQEKALSLGKFAFENALTIGDPQDTNLYKSANEGILNSHSLLGERSNCSSIGPSQKKDDESGHKIIFSLKYMPIQNKTTKYSELLQDVQSTDDVMHTLFQYGVKKDSNGKINGTRYLYSKELANLGLKLTKQKFLKRADYKIFVKEILNNDEFINLQVDKKAFTSDQKDRIAENISYQLSALDLLLTSEDKLNDKITSLKQEDKRSIPKIFSALFQTFNGSGVDYKDPESNYVIAIDGRMTHQTGTIQDVLFQNTLAEIVKKVDKDGIQNIFSLLNGADRTQSQFNSLSTNPVKFLLSKSKSILKDSGYDGYIVLNGISQKYKKTVPDLSLIIVDEKSKDIYENDFFLNREGRRSNPISSQYVFGLDGKSLANIPSGLSQYIDKMFSRKAELNSLFTGIENQNSEVTGSWQHFNSDKGRYLGIKTAVMEAPNGTQNFIIAVNHQQYKRMSKNPKGFLKNLSVALNTTVAAGGGRFPNQDIEQFFVTIRHNNAIILNLIESPYIKFAGIVGSELEASSNENRNLETQYRLYDKRDIDASLKLNQGLSLNYTPNSKNTFKATGMIQQYLTTDLSPFIDGVDNGSEIEVEDIKASLNYNGFRAGLSYDRKLNNKSSIQIMTNANFTRGGHRISSSLVLNKKYKNIKLSGAVNYDKNISNNNMSIIDLIAPNEGLSIRTSAQTRRVDLNTVIQLSRDPFFGAGVNIKLGKRK